MQSFIIDNYSGGDSFQFILNLSNINSLHPFYSVLTGNCSFNPQRINSFLMWSLKSKSSGDVTSALMSCIQATYKWQQHLKCRFSFQYLFMLETSKNVSILYLVCSDSWIVNIWWKSTKNMLLPCPRDDNQLSVDFLLPWI